MAYLYLSDEKVQVTEGSTRLVVLVHAYCSRPSHLRFLAQAVSEHLPDSDLMVPGYPAGKLANTPLSNVAEELVAAIDRAVEQRGERPYKEILLIGHSLGALIVRRAYLYARGQRMDHRPDFVPKQRSWTGLVTRMILIAAMNRGWRLDRKPDYMSRFDYWWNRFLAVVVPPFGKGDMILSVLQGAPFIVNLRLQWIRLERAAPDKMPRVVQLDGTRDDMIRSEDHHDLHAGHRFVQLKVHGAGHLDIVRFDEKLIGTWLHKLFYYLGRAALWICTLGRRKSAPVFGVRRETFVKALTSDPAQLDSDFPSQFKTDGGVDWVVFTVHGIRDFGHWTAGVEAAARQIGQSGGPQIVTARPRYNWFPMIDFLIGFRRRRNVEWLMDEYSTALATYPRADVSFIGHSNGTYLLSSALWRYLGCEFKHVILVGSVIPRAFPWDRLVPARVTSVCNIIGTRDVVVAVFPKLFEQVSEWFLRTDRLKIDPLGKGWPGIGSGGFNGFRSLPHGVTEQYVPGGHGAGVDASYHQALVQLATRPDNEAPVTIASKKLAGPNAFVRMLSIWSPAIWILLAGGLAWAIWHSPLWFARIGLDWNEWFLRGIAAVIAYFILKVA